MVQSPPEQCDDGTNLATYGGTLQGVRPGLQVGAVLRRRRGRTASSATRARTTAPATAYGAGVCTTACAPAPYCGDGVPQAAFGEQCDDGKNNGSYGTCNPNCTLAPYCGDGVKNGPEQCDNGDEQPAAELVRHGHLHDGCTVAPYCGDGIVETQFGEQCDGTPGCNAQCQKGSQ